MAISGKCLDPPSPWVDRLLLKMPVRLGPMGDESPKAQDSGAKANASTRAHSESWRKIELALPIDFARSALECDASPHRFQSIRSRRLQLGLARKPNWH